MFENRYGRGQRSLPTPDKRNEHPGKQITLFFYDLPAWRYGDTRLNSGPNYRYYWTRIPTYLMVMP